MSHEAKQFGKRDIELFSAILAAGSATRFGSAKQLARLHGESLVRRAVRIAESATGAKSVLCVGAEWLSVYQAASPLAGFVVRNDDHEKGMATSIAAVIRALPDSADGLLLLLADQPLIESADLDRLVQHWREHPERIACSSYAGTQGPPVIFPSGFFKDLLTITGDKGARAILKQHANCVDAIDMDAAAVDIDTPDDLSALEDR